MISFLYLGQKQMEIYFDDVIRILSLAPSILGLINKGQRCNASSLQTTKGMIDTFRAADQLILFILILTIAYPRTARRKPPKEVIPIRLQAAPSNHGLTQRGMDQQINRPTEGSR